MLAGVLADGGQAERSDAQVDSPRAQGAAKEGEIAEAAGAEAEVSAEAVEGAEAAAGGRGQRSAVGCQWGHRRPLGAGLRQRWARLTAVKAQTQTSETWIEVRRAT